MCGIIKTVSQNIGALHNYERYGNFMPYEKKSYSSDKQKSHNSHNSHNSNYSHNSFSNNNHGKKNKPFSDFSNDKKSFSGGKKPFDRNSSARPTAPIKDKFSSKPSYSDDFDRNEAPDAETNEERGFIIGRNPVIEALKADKNIDTIYVNSEAGGSIGVICGMANDKGIVVKQVTDAKLSAMCRGASHQGVIAVGACAEYVTPEEILDISKNKGTKPFIIICDEIEDPHNLGAVIRTAEAAGADGIIIPKRRSATLNSTVFKASAGAASWLPVAKVANIPAVIDMLKENGVWIYGTDATGSDYTKTDFSGPCAIVIGSEGFGLGRLVKEKCDYLVSLPMNGKITSLNASVAAGIFMYEVVRCRADK